jgi:sulfotransferase
MKKKMYFVAGLPRSGSTMIQCILRQNPQVHAEPVSSLAVCFNSIYSNWDNVEANKEFSNEKAKSNVLRGILQNYHEGTDKPIIFDKDRMWISRIALLEAVLGEKVKILCPVRNPAEILSSFEKLRKNNPMHLLPAEMGADGATIAGRCLYYAGPAGPLGIAHAMMKDAITMGYLDRLLFIDYNRFCNSPKSQTKRIYEFFELPSFDHDYEHIEQNEKYNDLSHSLPGLHKIKPKLDKTTVNCVEYLGLNLFEQYNREIFWDAWI